MKTPFKSFIFAVLASGIVSAAEGSNPSKKDIEAMLGKKGTYE